MEKPKSLGGLFVGVGVVALLVYVGIQYGEREISSSEAGTTNQVSVSIDASSPLPHLAIGGSTNGLHKAWRFAASEAPVSLVAMTATVKGNSSSVVRGLLRAKGENQVLAVAPVTQAGSRSVLAFNLGAHPLIVQRNSARVLELYLDYSPVDGIAVKNDQRYDTVIQSVADATFFSSAAGMPNVTFADGVSTPSYSYLFKSIPYFSLASSSPSGSLVPSDLMNTAEFNMTADQAADIGFNANNTGIRVTLDSAIGDVSGSSSDRIQIVRKSTGAVVGQTTINFVAGFNARKVWIPIKNLPVAAGVTETLQLRVDTDDFEDTGDSIRAWLDDAKPANVLWSVEGFGAYGHADILWRGDIYANALVKA